VNGLLMISSAVTSALPGAKVSSEAGDVLGPVPRGDDEVRHELVHRFGTAPAEG
jgi:hypothetical protein